MDLAQLFDYAARWVFICSVLSLILPPVEFFEEFPRFQAYYRLFGKFLKYWGNLNFRSKIIELYPQYQKAIESREKHIFKGKE